MHFDEQIHSGGATVLGLLHVLRALVVSWGVFLAGLGLVIAADWQLRLADGNIHSGGLPELAGYILHILVAVFALGLLAANLRRLRSWWARAIVLALNGLVGFAVYLVLLLSYVTESGIDSL